MTRAHTIATLLFTTTITQVATAAPPITIEGLFADWTRRPVAQRDPQGDGDLDIVRVKLADEPDWFQFLIESPVDFDLSENNELVLLIDTDDDASTGLQTEGIGAEVRFVLGDREGRFYTNPTSNSQSGTQIWHGDLSLQGAPTVTSNLFEVALSRNAAINGESVFTGDTIAMVLVDGGGERVPDTGALRHVFDLAAPPPPRDVSLDKERPGDVRTISWNVLRDNPWESEESGKFARMIQAIEPDILNLQEIYDHSPNQTRNRFVVWMDGTSNDWHVAGNNDCKTISRYPILHSEPLSGNLVVLVDTTEVLGRPLLIFNAHTPCCSNDDGRQWEIDEMLQFLGRVRAGNHDDIPSDVAVQIAGDLNLVGFAQQLESLVDGDIVNESEFGSDIAPDVDGSPLLDPFPLQTESRLAYTWRNDWSWYWPGRLDVTIISDSVLEPGRQLVLETRRMSAARLAEHGLQAEDSGCSDHLPIICDLREPSGLLGDLDGDGLVNGSDLGILLAAWDTDSDIADLNGDGIVNGQDLGLMLADWSD
ncbi:MAG: hypothetical protein CMJ34_03160 [Phycisphaerae bacterium]|nr:hypothetical protein [Phycisphaerae bacterium]